MEEFFCLRWCGIDVDDVRCTCNEKYLVSLLDYIVFNLKVFRSDYIRLVLMSLDDLNKRVFLSKILQVKNECFLD